MTSTQRRNAMYMTVATVLIACLATSVSAATIVSPGSSYVEDFDDGVADNFTVAGNNDWNLGSYSATVGGGVYTLHSNPRTDGYANSNVRVSNSDVELSGAVDAIFSVEATPTEIQAYNSEYYPAIRLNMFNNGTVYYQAELKLRTGEILIMQRDNDAGQVSTLQTGTFDSGSPSINTTYLLTFQTTYDTNGDVTLAFSVDDGTDLTTIATGPMTPTANSNGGFGIFQNSNNGSTTVDYDNFTITAVPEPTVMALLGIGGLMTLRRRRSA